MTPKPLRFGSSPPKGVKRCNQILPPSKFMSNMSSKTMNLCSVSSRKCYRRTNPTNVIRRPCLDFEKMRVCCYCITQYHNGINKSKLN
jgi:hypothetical protein